MEDLVHEKHFAALAFACLIAAAPTARAASTLDQVRSAGSLSCGVISEREDYSKFQNHGNLSALGRDICRALAAVTLGNPDKIAQQSFPDDPHGRDAVGSGKVALLVGDTPDPVNEVHFGISFGPPVFLDGEGFLVHRESGVTAVNELHDRQVCFIPETKNEEDLEDRLALRDLQIRAFPFEESGEMQAALVAGHCEAIAAPISALAGMRSGFHAMKVQYEILPETITLDPFAPAYRAGDRQWAEIVDWTVHALVLAEEAGVTQANAASQKQSGRQQVRYLLGGNPGVGKSLGLDDGWALRAIQAVGNYGELFDRDLGAGSNLKLARGHNALWNQGGMMYSPPIR
jgi:general L-amino acid transport system substrate-binding protein